MAAHQLTGYPTTTTSAFLPVLPEVTSSSPQHRAPSDRSLGWGDANTTRQILRLEGHSYTFGKSLECAVYHHVGKLIG